MTNSKTSSADTAPHRCRTCALALEAIIDWIYGDITVDENGAPYTYRYSMLFSFRNLEEFQAARRIIEALFEGVSRT